ncbi:MULTISPECIES: OmpH family outer membrane protein [unclassified Salinicola]|uniref:OmpH family outer membrane protein n=1 Tax=unclassified Salinicola TaxID=2634022 RepID=UPI0004E6102A|nr:MULTISPECIES: OmpH family outer membrane protein [unclassified Salinicola]KFF49523.1 molecular chaperone Skp [Gammaproteobacteria bacterium MFB021]WIX31996.1 OmpH family outer membrane protein [Salinicola sp. JS01]
MRKVIGALGLGLMTLVSLPAMATDVGVLDWRQALMSSQSAQASMNQLKNRIGPQQKQAEALGQQLQQLQEKLQKNGDVMSESERNAVTQQLRQKGGQFQQLRGQIAQAQQQAEQQYLKGAKPKLDQAIQRVVKQRGLDMVVDRDAVVYSGDSLDITNEVTKIFNSLN